jgi:hypothetical protein
MAREVSSISRVGTSEPFELQVSRGQIAYHEFVHKFGYNPDIADVDETVWAQGGLYVYPTAVSTMYISSSSTADTSAGTGARTATVSGLDANFDQISETVSLNGQTGVQLNGALNWYRVNRIIVNTAGSGGANAGVLYVGTEATPSGGVPTNKYATVAIGDNQTLMCLWTVPRGYTAYLHQKDVSASSSAGKFAIFTLISRPDNNVFNIKDRVTLANNSTNIPYWNPIVFTEKTDIEVRAEADSSGGTITASATLDITYIKNGDAL